MKKVYLIDDNKSNNMYSSLYEAKTAKSAGTKKTGTKSAAKKTSKPKTDGKKNPKYPEYDTVGEFVDVDGMELAVVTRKDYGKKMYNYINSNGEPISSRWFSNARPFDKYGFGTVKYEGMTYKVTADGLMIDKNIDEIDEFVNLGKDSIAMVSKTDKNGTMYNYIRSNGSLLSQEWFTDALPFDESGFGKVKKGSSYYYITRFGEISDKGFDDEESGETNISYYDRLGSAGLPVYVRKMNGANYYNFKNENGEYVLTKWVPEMDIRTYDKSICVHINGEYRLYDDNGNYISADKITPVSRYRNNYVIYERSKGYSKECGLYNTRYMIDYNFTYRNRYGEDVDAKIDYITFRRADYYTAEFYAIVDDMDEGMIKGIFTIKSPDSPDSYSITFTRKG